MPGEVQLVGLGKDSIEKYGKLELLPPGARGAGVVGIAKNETGVYGESESKVGVYGVSKNGLAAKFEGTVEVYGAAGFAGNVQVKGVTKFIGDVEVTGDIRLSNADCAEDFNVVGNTTDPGTVMVLDDEGALHQSHQAYDKRVAGVISGAGNYKPGIVLDKQPDQGNRRPIALLGKVYCKADARCSAIEVGDLLTTSPTPGHAMKALDQSKAFGAVIGKALRPLREGQGLIPILIALQ